jgi:hypothetical protein
MADILSISALVVSVGGVLINLLKTTHINKCKSLCCWSDCSQPALVNGRNVKVVKKGNTVTLVECPPTPPSPDEAEEPPPIVGNQPKIESIV